MSKKKLLLVLTSAIAYGVAFAQFEMPLPVANYVGTPSIVSIVNVTGDEKLEVVTGSAVYRIQPGQMDLLTLLPELSVSNTSQAKCQNVNGDEFADALIVDISNNSASVSIRYYSGQEEFSTLFSSSPIQLDFTLNPMDNITNNFYLIQDADLDGDVDVFVFRTSTDFATADQLAFFRNNIGVFEYVQDILLGSSVTENHVAIEDLNGDGLVDIFWNYSNTASCSLQLSNGTFDIYNQNIYSDATVNILYNALTSGVWGLPKILDANMDGLQDIVYDLDLVLFNQGDLNFQYSYANYTSCTLHAADPLRTDERFFDIRKICFDFDGDSDLDEFLWSTMESNLYYNRRESPTLLTSIYLTSMWGESGGGIAVRDYDLDGDLDMFYGLNSFLYLVENTGIEMMPDAGYFDGVHHTDYNSDFVIDEVETIYHGPIMIDDIFIYTGSEGVQLALPPGSHIFNAVADTSLWSTPDTLVTIEPDSFSNVTFHLEPIGYQPGLIGVLGFTSNICGADNLAVVYALNTGNTYFETAVIELELDTHYVFLNSEGNYSSLQNHYYFTKHHVNHANPCGTGIHILTPDANHIGEYFYNYVTVTGAGYDSGEFDYSHYHSCSYDPNYIEVSPSGYTSSGFVLPNTPMIYTVHFQNTGNAMANDVKIELDLPPGLRSETLDEVVSSHTVHHTSITADGHVEFFFNNILLPDSGSNLEGSNGYIVFKVMHVPDIAPGTVLPLQASIVFDQNAPVVTNTVENAIFDCSWMNSEVIVPTEVCQHAPFHAESNNEFHDQLIWMSNGDSISFSQNLDFVFTSDGLNTLQLETANPLCVVTHNYDVNVLQVPAIATINQNGNVLTVDTQDQTQWLLNDQIMDGYTDASIEIVESGIYQCEITNSLGCSSMTASQSFVFTQVPESTKFSCRYFPNPMKSNERITIETMDPVINSIFIFDSAGRIVFQVNNTMRVTTITPALNAGIYTLQIHSSTGQSSGKLIVLE